MSVEFEEAPEFIKQVSAEGVVVAIGHTAAEGEQIRAAVDAGAQLSTHLGNGAHRTLRRHPNYLWDQLSEDRLWASLIVDGQHLPPEVVKAFRPRQDARPLHPRQRRVGTGRTAPGRYTSSGCELEILADGRLVIAGQQQLLAGASRPIGAGLVNVMRFAGVDLAAAVGMATVHPAQLLDVPHGGLQPGDPADLVLFHLPAESNGAVAGLDVQATIADGRLVYGSLDESA